MRPLFHSQLVLSPAQSNWPHFPPFSLNVFKHGSVTNFHILHILLFPPLPLSLFILHFLVSVEN